ncbi:type II toxin-antitoxin system RelE/ParE family toxin [Flavobacterium sp. S87F.05.LMB.W.Kidney.N]|uniref:type II toxin-antitoxin system RelE/ParE family toxin n=1 Tax=Flavobacterium sp. S87F.05.LMB.W.Kidney.N TaxID=1278758 RepID=UPI0010668933|nr:type II toxin-antitoxin system RelE/ParE family toxin [Flavobacterium sp. S87F.05.LMB.W.Kidney.N]TDX09009.1 ParE-like toxin of type II ParDE toxin-antitoxin system [Flavobacterium sp. S87F.05.LMB.W.Kidney.N]
MYKIRFVKEALFDIEDAVLWYEKQRIGLSYDFELCLEAGIDSVLRNPDLFQKKYKKIRIHFISRFPYGIHYLVEKDEIVVIGVFHTSRSPKNWSKRLSL